MSNRWLKIQPETAVIVISIAVVVLATIFAYIYFTGGWE